MAQQRLYVGGGWPTPASDEGQRSGGRLVAGGSEMPAGMDRGWCVRPTVFADVDNGSRIARDGLDGYRDAKAISFAGGK